VAHPELAWPLPALYPGVFPHLAALDKSGKARGPGHLADRDPGLPDQGFPEPHRSVLADMLRLNTAIKPSRKPSILGVLGGDLASFRTAAGSSTTW
jgi:hypothetical protein